MGAYGASQHLLKSLEFLEFLEFLELSRFFWNFDQNLWNYSGCFGILTKTFGITSVFWNYDENLWNYLSFFGILTKTFGIILVVLEFMHCRGTLQVHTPHSTQIGCGMWK